MKNTSENLEKKEEILHKVDVLMSHARIFLFIERSWKHKKRLEDDNGCAQFYYHPKYGIAYGGAVRSKKDEYDCDIGFFLATIRAYRNIVNLHYSTHWFPVDNYYINQELDEAEKLLIELSNM